MAGFTNRVALVTGGSGNLGSAVVQRLHAAGAHLIVPDRSAGKLAMQFPELANTPDHLLLDSIDVTDPKAADQMAEAALARFGRIDVLINTVGGYRAGTPVHETPLDTWDFMLNLNARAVFLVCRAVLPAMLIQQHGAIVNVSSTAALHGGANASAYSASKSAVARLTESMADEYKRTGITVNAVLPGTIDTPQNREAMPKADTSLWVSPDALADVILFLASEAGSVINGALIPVTGKQ